ncbi:MAG: hypothetical protein ACTSUE_18695 [Promethearchaeota archaeon]
MKRARVKTTTTLNIKCIFTTRIEPIRISRIVHVSYTRHKPIHYTTTTSGSLLLLTLQLDFILLHTMSK